jgi:DNA topoisomerase-1
MTRLVVVESPTKARTIRRFLPAEYRVEASMGHVRDLPASAAQIPARFKGQGWSRLGVNVDNDFEPLYVIPPDKRKVIKILEEALKGADELFIATDEDREGESIGWHLLEVLRPKVPVRRMVFHEITREAIHDALGHTRDMDRALIDAQETRRILDRLVGYSLSPLLWKKIAPRLSAGRVQSVAVRLLVSRETERILFVPASYWDLAADLVVDGSGFEASLTQLDGIRVAGGRDFDDATGRLAARLTEGVDVVTLDEARATALAESLPEAEWTVSRVESKEARRSPYAPFITSTLQQEASRKLRLSARDTMSVAQRLYEQGFITYMRTDSTTLSNEAMRASRQAVEDRYGKEYLSPKPREFASKVRNAQEAHEAIRPAGTDMKTADELRLSGVERALYDLVWKRTVASQMADARLRLVSADIEASTGPTVATFRATGRTIEFPGFFRAYVEGSDDPEAALEDRDQPLPHLEQGMRPGCSKVEARGHETRPPARLTDASLIRVLEGEGIGRPSTYASIIDTIVSRGYVRRAGGQLVPTFTAFATNNLLEAHFEQLVDVGFTAGMEQVLDDIAAGSVEAVPYLQQFYRGEDGLAQRVEEGLDAIDARKVSEIRFAKWDPYVVRVGKYGPYVETSHDGDRQVASLPDDLAPGDVTRERLEELVTVGRESDRVLGIHPEGEMPVLLCRGPYGLYVQLGDDDHPGKPKRVSLPRDLAPESVDLEIAVRLLSLPRALGSHPDTGQDIVSNVGRYGPYVQHGSTFASLSKDDDVLEIGLERALELLSRKEMRNKPLRTIGKHPESGNPVEIFEGRYGPFVKHDRTNASLPKDVAPESVTMDLALELLAARAERGPAKKGRGRKKKG